MNLVIENNADLNILNKKGETPLAFALPSLLNEFELSNGITTVHHNSQMSIDNNSLLLKNKKFLGNSVDKTHSDFMEFEHEPLKNYSFKVKENPQKIYSFYSGKKLPNTTSLTMNTSGDGNFYDEINKTNLYNDQKKNKNFSKVLSTQNSSKFLSKKEMENTGVKKFNLK